MQAKRNIIGLFAFEAMESRLFMSVSAPVVDNATSFTAGQMFTPITVDQASPSTKPEAVEKWLKVKLVNTVTGNIALTRTYFPKEGLPLVAKNLLSDQAGNFDVVMVDSLGRKSTLEEVTVTPAAPHALWFSSQPRVLDENAMVTVSVVDQFGNVTSDADGSALVLHSWLPRGTPGPAPVLDGSAEAVIVNGVAAFTGLSMNETGQAHLIARLDDLKPAVSNVFHSGATLKIGDGSSYLA